MAAKKKAVTEEPVEGADVAVEATAAAEAAADPAKESAPAKAKADKKFPIDNLAKNCRELFGASSCTFAGATAGLTGEYTVEEMKSIITEWCGKEIK